MARRGNVFASNSFVPAKHEDAALVLAPPLCKGVMG